MTKRLAVWLKYPGEDGLFRVDPSAAALGKVLGETYIRRVVLSYEELVEKIKIADAGLDDFEIETVKLFVYIREQIDITAPFVFAGRFSGEPPLSSPAPNRRDRGTEPTRSRTSRP